ncbi:MAG: hypothetical protein HND44_04020 [Chloroflexi bacterium]|nr:hypothetical protein [Ardenticatenaceae bacterium]MBL1127667.1 hypothetical protein [Chloroflexota bacterium]NOG33732.1 hypothetical protein [Chloroflexota bacterium]GIK56053.1 MAG: hypothetical protein BroJett015_17160 [Chloroflexota bacterium]
MSKTTPLMPSEQAAAQLPKAARLLLGVLAISAFLSDVKFIPGIRNNVGPFELFGFLFIVMVLVHYYRDNIKLYFHPLIIIVGWWFILAFTSLLWLVEPDNLQLSLVQVVVFLFQFFFLLVMYNVLLREPDLLLPLFRWFAVGVLFVGIWVLIDQITSGGNLNAVGPFRGRSHMGIYMFGAFWILLIYTFWPGLSRRERWLIFPLLAMVAYTIAISLRQSVYTAFIVGLVGLVASLLILRGSDRLKITIPALFVSGILALLFFYGGESSYSVNLFRRELTGLDARLSQATASLDDPENVNSFDSIQRRGAIQSFMDHPVRGIGWQGFYRSIYSGTGNELHSTPWRLLAELGLLGFIPYLIYLSILLLGSVRLFLLARPTPYQLPAMIMMVAFFSVTVSHYYNRMFTDRPNWFLLVVFLIFEAIVRHERQKQTVPPKNIQDSIPLYDPLIATRNRR